MVIVIYSIGDFRLPIYTSKTLASVTPDMIKDFVRRPNAYLYLRLTTSSNEDHDIVNISKEAQELYEIPEIMRFEEKYISLTL